MSTLTTPVPNATVIADVAATAVAEARAAVLAARSTLQQWETARDAAERELAEVEAAAGEALLADPDAEEEISAHMSRLRMRRAAAAKAIAAQEPRVLAAESQYLSAEAVALLPEWEQLGAWEEAHKAKVRRLLDQLQKLEQCEYVPAARVSEARNSAIHAGAAQGTLEGYRMPLSEDSDLRRQRVRLERQIRILQELAAGRPIRDLVAGWRCDPSGIVPACAWGPDALVPADQYLERVENATALIRELEATRATLPAEIAKLEAAERDAQSDPAYASGGGTGAAGPIRLAALDRQRRRAQTIDGEIEQARATLAALAQPTAVTQSGGDVPNPSR